MKLPGRFILLRILAAVAIGAFVYAGAVTLRAVLFDADGGLFALLLFAIIVLSGNIAGWYFWKKTPKFAVRLVSSKFASFLHFMLHVKNGINLTMSVAAWSAMLIPLLATLLIYRKAGLWRILFEMLLTVVAYIMSLKHSSMSSMQILQKNQVYTGFFVMAVCLETTYFIKNIAYLRPWLFAACYYFILAFLITRNQEDIDSNIFDKKHVEKSILPRNLRRFNTYSVCVVFLVILLFFNFKKVVSAILQFILKLIFYIMKGFLWLMSALLPIQQGASQGGGSQQEMGFFGEGIALINPFKNLLANTVKYFVIIYISYRLLVFLWRKIPKLVRRVVEWIKRLLSIKKGSDLPDTEDYKDETERVKPVRERRIHSEMKRRMRKSKKDLKGVSDPVERVRYLYSSILHMLPLLGVKHEISDTTMELLRKASPQAVVTELSPLTRIYNQVRYGGKIPDALMLEEAEGHYKKVADAANVK